MEIVGKVGKKSHTVDRVQILQQKGDGWTMLPNEIWEKLPPFNSLSSDEPTRPPENLAQIALPKGNYIHLPTIDLQRMKRVMKPF